MKRTSVTRGLATRGPEQLGPHVGNAGNLRHAYLAKEKGYPRQAQGQGGTREHQGKEKQTKEHRKRQKPKEKTGPGSQKGQEGGPRDHPWLVGTGNGLYVLDNNT